MNATIEQILFYAFPDRGGWTVQLPRIEAGDGGPPPTMEEIESHRAATEAALEIAEADRLATLAARKVWEDSAAFFAEFTFPETSAIELSQNATVAGLRILLAAWPGEVWSDDPRIVLGLNELVAAGIITPERRAAIIAK